MNIFKKRAPRNRAPECPEHWNFSEKVLLLSGRNFVMLDYGIMKEYGLTKVSTIFRGPYEKGKKKEYMPSSYTTQVKNMMDFLTDSKWKWTRTQLIFKKFENIRTEGKQKIVSLYGDEIWLWCRENLHKNLHYLMAHEDRYPLLHKSLYHLLTYLYSLNSDHWELLIPNPFEDVITKYWNNTSLHLRSMDIVLDEIEENMRSHEPHEYAQGMYLTQAAQILFLDSIKEA